MELGEEIKARRVRHGLTLDGLAERTGVSRAMLSEIERGTKNPTIRVVCQIADGLGATVSELIGEGVPQESLAPSIVRAGERQTLVDPQSGVTRQLLAPAYLRHGVEVLWYNLPPGAATGSFPAHRPGVVEQITVVRGTLRCRLGGDEALLDAGDAIFFPADLPHSFANPGDEVCEYLLIIDSRGVAPLPPAPPPQF